MDEQTVHIGVTGDIVVARHRGRELARDLGFSTLEQTRLATAISELTRNVIQHAGSGECRLRAVRTPTGDRVEVVVVDAGPGIPNIALAMSDGFSSRGSLGVGLPGTQRIVNEFDIRSEPGRTEVRIAVVRQRHGAA